MAISAVVMAIVPPATAEDTESLDIARLTEGVRDTSAMSFVAKLEVKSRAERFIDDMARFHQGQGEQELSSLEARFNALLDWVVSLVSPDDPELHDQLVASRDAIWETLADPSSFTHRPLRAKNLRD